MAKTETRKETPGYWSTRKIPQILDEILDDFEVSCFSEVNWKNLLKFLMKRKHSKENSRLHWHIYYFLTEVAGTTISISQFKAYLRYHGYKSPKESHRIQAYEDILITFGGPDAHTDLILRYYTTFCVEYHHLITGELRDQGQAIIDQHSWKGNPRAIAGGVIWYLVEAISQSRKGLSIGDVAVFLNTTYQGIRKYYTKIREMLGNAVALSLKKSPKRKNPRQKPTIKKKKDPIPPKPVRSFRLIDHGTRIEIDRYPRPHPPVHWGGFFPLTGGGPVESYEQFQLHMDLMEAMDKENYFRETVHWDGEERFLELLHLTKKDPRYEAAKVSMISEVFQSLRLQFGVMYEDYDSEFLQWLYAHPFWEQEPALCYYYLFYYLHERYNWPLLRMFIDYLMAKDIYHNATQATLDTIPREISEAFGTVRQLKTLVAQHAGSMSELQTEIFRIFQRYGNGLILEIPPWAETDLAFYTTNQSLFEGLLQSLRENHLYFLGDHLEWTQIINTGKWARVRTDSITVYFSHSIRTQQTPREVEEFNLIHDQFANDDKIINTGWLDWDHLGIPKGPAQMDFCLELIQKSADVFVFSEYQQHIGKGVYSELQTARAKGIPIFLLRDSLFYLNPQAQISDETDWAVKYARVTATPIPPVREIAEILDKR